jgi:hypothetical protein
VLEHVDYIPLLREIWRISKPGGLVHVRVPHFTSSNAYSDPTHKRFFNSDTFYFFVAGHDRSYYFDFSFTVAKGPHICFGPRAFRVIELSVNRNRRMQQIYEASPLRIFPATNIEIDLIK